MVSMDATQEQPEGEVRQPVCVKYMHGCHAAPS